MLVCIKFDGGRTFVSNSVSGLMAANIDEAYLTFLKNFKPIDEAANEKAKKAFDSAQAYLTQEIPGGNHPWQEIIRETYQGKKEKGDPLFDLITSLDYLVGIYEINVWNTGRLGCSICKEHVPAFLRVIDGDEGTICNRCWYKK